MSRALDYCQKRLKILEAQEKKYARESRKNKFEGIWSDHEEDYEYDAHRIRCAQLRELRKVNNILAASEDFAWLGPLSSREPPS